MAGATTFAALLRGINVGGRNKIPMTELRASLSALGLERVATYIQSGNVVFQSPAGAAQEIAAGIERQIVDVFGIGLAVMLRTPAELGAIADANPFLEGEGNLSRLHVAFLDRAPTASAVTQLDPHRSPPDAFSVAGCEIYLHFPNGSGRSKLTIDYFERRLGVRATARNWKTLVRVRAMTQELADGPSA